MESTLPHSTKAPTPAHTRYILRRHRPFMVVTAFALSLLFAQEAWAVSQFWSFHSPAGNWILGSLILLVAFVGNAFALLGTPLFVRPEQFPRPVGAFAQATGLGLATLLVTNGVAFFLLLLLAGFNLDATVNVLKDVYVYTVLGVLVHGLIYYVRHMHWLYDQFGSADSPLKPIAASGGIAAMIFIVTIVFLPLDLQSINVAPQALQGLVGLNVYLRDLYLLTLVLGVYAWHLRWIADH